MRNIEALPHIKEIGSFFTGGYNTNISNKEKYEAVFVKGGPTRAVDPNGDFESGQMYVQYYKLMQPKYKTPVLLWHGGGVTGACWETTPDKREGWLQLFLRKGYDVYNSDAVERGRSGFSRYPEIYQSEPVFRSKQEAWLNFRIGKLYDTQPNKRVTLENTQFPYEFFDTFMKQNVPRWLSNNKEIMQAYEEYLLQVENCILVVHSQAGEFAGHLIQKYPNKIKAAVMLEVSSAPNDIIDGVNVPMLYIWGDNIEPKSLWEKYRFNVQQFYFKQKQAGQNVEWIDLPELGISGNSHFLMMDKNSIDIFKIVNDWLEKNLIK